MSPIEANEVLTVRALAGAAAVSPSAAMGDVDESGLTADDFATKIRAVFAGMLKPLRNGQAPELMTLLQDVGTSVPREVVVDVMTNPDVGVLPQRLHAQRQAARLRTLIASVTELTAMIRKDGVSFDSAHAEAMRVLHGLGDGADTLRAADGALMTLLEHLETVQKGQRAPLLLTGVAALDFFIGGLRATLTVIASMPGVGKSALLAAIVRNLIVRDVKVGVLSLEDEREWLLRRLLAFEAKVPLFVLGTRPLSTEQLKRTEDAAESMHAALANLIIEDRAAMTTADVVAAARRMIASGCKAIFVDHLGEIRLERTDRHDLDIADALQQLRALAKTYRVPVVVLCHLRRRDGLDVGNAPKLSDFAFSAAVERMARVALGLYRTNSGNIGCALLKQTEGPGGFDFELNFAKLYGIVEDTPLTAGMRDALGWAS